MNGRGGVNPVELLLKSADTTEKAFRERFGYSKQFLVDITAGTYTRLPDSVHRHLRQLAEDKGVDATGILWEEYRVLTLDAAYFNWQAAQRGLVSEKFKAAVRPTSFSAKLSPAHFMVKELSGSPTRFSKELKVPPQQVRRWISGQTRSMPVSLQAALVEVGYPWLRELIQLQSNWLERT